ncbi:hypothetical protein C0993_007901 [Termitomyces sp. T159_Od127]|nr:hypothetical protein C0993_007901 [Termitomyces sp. T159_Od127]
MSSSSSHSYYMSAQSEDTFPRDTDNPSSRCSTTENVTPVFEEEPRTFTAKDLIAILSLYNTGYKKDDTSGISRMPTKEEASTSEALEILTGKESHKRMVYRCWPRDPKGKNITPANTLPGKTTPNGIQLWGATIFDFYRVNRMPDVTSLSTITTGSKLMRWMKANGETEYAKDEIAWAEMEEDPKILDLWSPRMQIQEMEENVRQGKAGITMSKQITKGKEVSTGSLFDAANYPSSWPLVPFSYETERLTSTIDLDHLPKKLVVHDPWNVVAVKSENVFGQAKRYKGEEWTSMKDVTHVYRLKLSKHGVERAKAEAEERIKAEERKALINESMDDPPRGFGHFDKDNALEGYLIRPPAIPGPVEPPIFVVHGPPPRPHAPAPKVGAPIEEAHLYLSPKHVIGIGNHSVVYQAEWELPRSAIIPPPSNDFILCEHCVEADIARLIREEDGENGERKDPKWKELSGEIKLVPEGRPSVVFHVVQRQNLDKSDSEEGQFETQDCTYRVEYVGPVRPIRTTVEWQDTMHPTCEHLKPPPEVPPTVKMRVIGKLSLKYDEHLVREAANYESFEKHMFQHWSGFNVLPPMHDPVPVGALVPQFYGYYVPESDFDDDEGIEDEEKQDKEVRNKNSGYFSPILLLEDCGSPVDPKELTHDQKNEALSLIYRFHHAGWAHGSIYPRNIVSQPGPISAPPSQRSRQDQSFRLIDFGRSFQRKDHEGHFVANWRDDRWIEESSVEKLFEMGLYSY